MFFIQINKHNKQMKISHRTRRKLAKFAKSTDCVRTPKEVCELVSEFITFLTPVACHGANLLKVAKILLTISNPLLVAYERGDEYELSSYFISDFFPRNIFRVTFVKEFDYALESVISLGPRRRIERSRFNDMAFIQIKEPLLLLI